MNQALPIRKPRPEGPLSLSLVVPVFNEEETVHLFVEAIEAVREDVIAKMPEGGGIEIVFVDDGSRDRTVEKVLACRSDHLKIRLVRLSRNFGKDSALTAGLAHAKGDGVVPMDVDLQDPPEILPEMVEAWVDGAYVVNAMRMDRSSDNWFKRKAANTFYRIYNKIAAYPITPNVGDFRLLDRQVIEALNMMPERIRFMKGLFSWVGFSPTTVGYTRTVRVAGTTKWKPWSLWNFALDGITGSSTLPLRIWTYVGGFIAVLAVAWATLIFFRTLIYGADVPGYASLMVIGLTLGAAILIALGVIGEYVGRIAIEVRQRPLYVVADAIDCEDAAAPVEVAAVKKAAASE